MTNPTVWDIHSCVRKTNTLLCSVAGEAGVNRNVKRRPLEPTENLAEGQRRGRWTLIQASGRKYWRCRCECGTEKLVETRYLKNGQSRSCGCYLSDLFRQLATTHGKSFTPEYGVWRSMLSRCFNPKTISYPNYGGRGISVCERWHKFEDFFADVGSRPRKGMTLERRDNDGNYEPSNCYWATGTEQHNNKRTNHRIVHLGRSFTLTQAARMFNIRKNTLRARLERGWTVDAALTTPVRAADNNN